MSRAVCERKWNMINERKSIIYLEMYLYKAKKLIIKRNCTVKDLDEAEIYLNKCRSLVKGTKESRIDVWFGKLELKRSKLSGNSLDKKVSLENAKNSFFMALNKTQTPSANYGLFKVFVAEENWVSAKNYLMDFAKSDRKGRYDFTLIYRMLDTCMGMENNYTLTKSSYIFSNKVDYQPLKDNYRLAEESFMNKQYNRCLKHLLICQKLAFIKSITIDFSQSIDLINKIIAMKNIKDIDELKASVLLCTNSGERIILCRKLLSIAPNEIDLYFLLIDSYIELGVYGCILEILAEVTKYKLSELDLRRVKYYENLAHEQAQYNSKMISIYKSIQVGEEIAANGEMPRAFNHYLAALNKDGHSVFLSKIGDLFYVNGYYKQAEQYYLRYLTIGYENQFDVYVNLYKTYRRLNDPIQAHAIAINAFNGLFLSTKGYTLESWISQLEAAYNKDLNGEEVVDNKLKSLQA